MREVKRAENADTPWIRGEQRQRYWALELVDADHHSYRGKMNRERQGRGRPAPPG